MKTNQNKVRIAIPVTERNGLQSKVSHHFGKSIGFMLVDSNGGFLAYMDTVQARHEGECAPIKALRDNECDVVLCHSMGRGAYERCLDAGIQVMKINSGDRVIDVLDAYNRQAHCEFGSDSLCAHRHETC